MARPTILTQEIQDKLCALIAQGIPKDKACWSVGIDDSTLFQWIEKGMQPEQPNQAYVAFVDAIKKAEFEFVQSTIRKIEAAEPGHWQKWMTLGERLQPSVFGRTERVQVSGNPDQPIPIAFTGAEKSS